MFANRNILLKERAIDGGLLENAVIVTYWLLTVEVRDKVLGLIQIKVVRKVFQGKTELGLYFFDMFELAQFCIWGLHDFHFFLWN